MSTDRTSRVNMDNTQIVPWQGTGLTLGQSQIVFLVLRNFIVGLEMAEVQFPAHMSHGSQLPVTLAGEASVLKIQPNIYIII